MIYFSLKIPENFFSISFSWTDLLLLFTIIIIIIIISSSSSSSSTVIKFVTPTLAGGLSLESEWQQFS